MLGPTRLPRDGFAATAEPRLTPGYVGAPNGQPPCDLFHECLQLLTHCCDALIDRLQIDIRLLRRGV